jgi:hypothetical protein
MRMEMSEPVRAAVDEAVLLIESLVAKLIVSNHQPRVRASG